MDSNEMAGLAEEMFKKISGSSDVKYKRLFYNYGMGAYEDSAFRDRDAHKFWEAVIVRRFGDSIEEKSPTGPVNSLKFRTGYLIAEGEKFDKPLVATNIDCYHAEEDINDRINQAIQTQKETKDLINSGIDYLKVANNHPIRKMVVQDLDNKGFSLSLLAKDKDGKAPVFPMKLQKKFGDRRFENSYVQVQGVLNDDLLGANELLDFQIQRFGGLVK